MTVKTNVFLKLLAASCIALAISSCGSENQGENTEADTSATTIVTDETEAEEANISLPSPLQIASIFKRSGLTYIDGLTNPTTNISKYSSNNSKAVNMGIYTSDLAYCVLNKQNQHSINYLKASRELANQLGMGSVFEANDLTKRFEANISREDSLATIIAELQMQSDLFLEENEMIHTAAIIFAGAWIESMYLGGKVYEKTNNEKITGRIIEQMTILENLIKVLKIHESKDAAIGAILAHLVSVQDTYLGLASVKAATANSSDEEYTSPELTKEELSTLTSKIAEIREKVTQE